MFTKPSHASVAGHNAVATTDTYGVSKVFLKLPALWSRDGRFYCDGKELVFHRRGRRLALLKAFLAAPNHQLNRQQIITLVYGESQLHRRSPRYAECLNMNVLRTISDTRRQLYVTYGRYYPGLDWLHFNRGEKKWKLVRFRDGYVLAHLHARVFSLPDAQDNTVEQRVSWHRG